MSRMLSWLQVNLQLAQNVLNCIQQFGPAFDIDTAVGTQLDTLGVIIGQGRTVAFQPSGGASPTLDDTSYRVLLRSRIAQNHWDGKLDSLLGIWQQIFPGGLLIINDHQDMTVDLYVAASLSSILQDLVLHGYIVPKPQAVKYTYAIATLPMFGLDRSDSFVAGVDLGHIT